MAEMYRLYTDYRIQEDGGITLFVIDPQYDFHVGGSLAIPTADADSDRIASFILKNIPKINDIVVSLDTHQHMHIAHKAFWVSVEDNSIHPSDFTIINAEDVNVKWQTTAEEHRQWGLEYVTKLEQNSRFKLCIWPDHCLIGTPGHAVYRPLHDALMAWADFHNKCVEYVLKGNNVLTEHYSAMQADVIRPDDPRTHFNQTLFDRLRAADQVLICGQAKSHCVAFTTRDLIAHWPEESTKQLILLDDCTSPVPGFEAAANDFIAEVSGVIQIATSGQIFQE